MATAALYSTTDVARDFQSKATDTKLDHFVAVTRDSDLLTVILFGFVALVIAICLVRFLPLPFDVVTYVALAS